VLVILPERKKAIEIQNKSSDSNMNLLKNYNQEAYICDSSYLGGRNGKDCSSSPAQTKN
jgi:hypothetical protein